MCARGLRARITGFTLIELMIVVAIIAIVSAAVVPSMSRTLQKNRQKEAAYYITQAISLARARAASNQRTHRVRVRISPAGAKGGGNFGGSVAVDECVESQTVCCLDPTRAEWPTGECIAVANLRWRRIEYKSVFGSTDDATDLSNKPAQDNHAGLVGQDVAISAIQMGSGTFYFAKEQVGVLDDQGRRWLIIATDMHGDPIGKGLLVSMAASGETTIASE